MTPLRPSIGALARFLIVTAVGCVALLWPGGPAERAYARIFPGIGAAACSLLAGDETTFVRIPGSTDAGFIVTRNGSEVCRAPLSSAFTGLVPFAVFLALMLATRVPWRQKLVASLAGSVLIHAYIGTRILIVVAYRAVVAREKLRGSEAPAKPWFHDLVPLIHLEPTVYALAPVVVWVVAVAAFAPSALSIEGRDPGA